MPGRLAGALFTLCASGHLLFAAKISGIVTDESGRPVAGARLDHLGEVVVVGPPSYNDPNQRQTDREGHFEVITGKPAFVIRKPGYESQRILVNADQEVKVTLRALKTPSCTINPKPKAKTKDASDIDYQATWMYIETPHGPMGILSGHGYAYSFGAPLDDRVWRSSEYFEVMYPDRVIDARGREANGEYWRSQTWFGAATHYSGMDRETAEKLDCLMDRVLK